MVLNKPSGIWEDLMRNETISSLGLNLPVGLSDQAGNLVKGFDLKRYTFKDDKELAEKREGAVTAGRFASHVIKHFATSIGGVVLLDIPQVERDMLVNRLTMGDAFTLYINIRIKAKGKIFKPVMTCPACSFKFRDTVDLASTVVRCVDKLDELKHEFKLGEAYEVKIGDVVTKFDTLTISAPLWSEIETLSPEKFNNAANITEAVVKGAIHAIGDLDETKTRAALSSGVLDTFSKLDIDDVTEFINDNAPGPEMVIDTKCKRCRAPFSTSIDWGFDSFFATSSRSKDSIRS